MAGTLVQELMNGGLVTIREPSMLREGELQQCDETVYRKFDPAIYGAWNRTEYDSTPVAVSAVKGVTFLPFDTVLTDKFLAYIGTSIYQGDFTALTGSLDTPLIGPGTVAACAISGTVTLTTTTPNGFQYVPTGARVIHANIPAGATVTFVNNTTLTLSITSTVGSGLTIAFTTGISIPFQNLGTENLDAVQFGNKYFLMTGSSNPLYVAGYTTLPGNSVSSFSARRAGLEAVTTFADGSGTNTASLTLPSQFSGPSVVAGTWSTVLGNGFYWFLVTEAINATKEKSEVESAYTANSGRASVAQISSYAANAIKITFPPAVNTAAKGLNQATHWCVYMSQRQPDQLNMPSLATFTLVAVEDISATFSILSDAALAQETSTFSTNSTVGGTVTNPTGAYTFYDGSEASFTTSGTNTLRVGGGGLSIAAPYAGLTIRGIVLKARVRMADGSGHIPFTMKCRAGSKESITQNGEVTNDHYTEVVFGSATDTLGVTWASGDFADGTFFIDIGCFGVALSIPLGIKLDGLRVAVYYTGVTINNNGRSFSVVTYRSQVGISVSDPANLPPPAADTGDVFMGHLVLNDTGNANAIVYSLPERPESFPKPYQMTLNSRRRDQVTFIRTVGQVLVIGMKASIKRLNYLPTEADPDFQLGRAHEDLATDHGIVGPMAGALVEIEGATVLVYAAFNGIHVTDGITTRFLNIDIDWTAAIDMSNISKCIMRAYPRENLIALFYPPSGGSGTNSKCLLFSYAPDKVKEGGFYPATGPNSVSARSACEVTLNGLHYLLTGHESNGKVYVEDNGTTLPSGYTAGGASVKNVPVIQTRLFYPAGIQNDVREERIYLLCSANGTTYTKTAVSAINSTALTSSGAFDANIRAGMLVTGDNIQAGTVVTAKTDTSNLTLSLDALASGSGSVVFSDGVITVQVRGRNIKEAVTDLDGPVYDSTHIGGLIEFQPDNLRHSLALKISRMTLPSGTTVDLSVPTRLHYFAYLLFDGGQVQKRT